MPGATRGVPSNKTYETVVQSTSKKYTKSTTWPDTRLVERDVYLNKSVFINKIQVFLGPEESLCSGKLGRVHACHHVGRL